MAPRAARRRTPRGAELRLLRAAATSASTRSSSAIRATLDLPAARRAARGRPVVFNPLVSLADTLVADRGRFRAGLAARAGAAALDRRAFRAADLVVADTAAHADTSPSPGRRGPHRGLPRRRRGAPLQARLGAGRPVQALFVGKLIPLHGLETILAAARLAPELRFRVVGSGQLEPPARRAAAERRARPLGRVRAAAGRAAPCVVRARHLRHVGESGARDPEQGLPGACLRHPPRHRGHAGGPRAAPRRRERAPCPSRRSQALAAALRRLAGDPVLADALSAGGLAAYRAQASEEVLGPRWRGLIESLPVKPRALLWAAMAAYAAGFGSLSILRHRAFNTGRYDLGNMVQTVWNTAHGHFLQMTSGDGRQISRLAAPSTRSSPRWRPCGGSGRAPSCC